MTLKEEARKLNEKSLKERIEEDAVREGQAINKLRSFVPRRKHKQSNF